MKFENENKTVKNVFKFFDAYNFLLNCPETKIQFKIEKDACDFFLLFRSAKNIK
jgi:hypothetical protein